MEVNLTPFLPFYPRKTAPKADIGERLASTCEHLQAGRVDRQTHLTGVGIDVGCSSPPIRTRVTVAAVFQNGVKRLHIAPARIN